MTDGLLARATKSGTVPKLFHLLTDSEYFNRAGSLVHTDPTGTTRRAAAVHQPDLFRRLGPAHRRRVSSGAVQDPDFVGQADMNPLVYAPVIRALFRALDRWVS